MMKKILLILTMLFGISFGANAFTRKEYIQENLSKLGIKQDIINETIELDKEIGTRLIFEGDEQLLRKWIEKAEKILKKDKRNFVAANFLADNQMVIGQGSDNKYREIFQKYTPYESERLLSLNAYYMAIGDNKKAEETFNKIKSKFQNTLILKIAEMNKLANSYKGGNDKNTMLKINTLRREIVEELNSEKVKREYGITDEIAYSFKLMIILNDILEYYGKEEYQKEVDLYLKKVADVKVPEGLIDYNIKISSMILLAVLDANDEIKDTKKAKENFDKIEQSQMYKQLEKFIEENMS